MRLVVCAMATTLGGCVGNFVTHKDLPEVKQAVVAEMKLVIPHVKPEHLQQCREMLELPSILGVAYKLNGPLSPSIQHSCAAQNRYYLTSFETEEKVVVFTAPVVQVAGFGMTWDVQLGVCSFRMKVGDPQITVSSGPKQGPADDICHRV